MKEGSHIVCRNVLFVRAKAPHPHRSVPKMTTRRTHDDFYVYHLQSLLPWAGGLSKSFRIDSRGFNTFSWTWTTERKKHSCGGCLGGWIYATSFPQQVPYRVFRVLNRRPHGAVILNILWCHIELLLILLHICYDKTLSNIP